MKDLTITEAIGIIGDCLAHDSLRLSQKEHLIAIQAFNKIKDAIKEKAPEEIQPQIK